MPRRNIAPPIQFQGIQQSLSTPGVSAPVYQGTPAFSRSAEDMKNIIKIMQGFGDIAEFKGKEKRRLTALEEGLGAEFAQRDLAYLTPIFEAGPTQDTLDFFPTDKIRLGDEPGLSDWSLGLIASRTGTLSDDAKTGYIEEILPKLIKMGGSYVGDREQMWENQRIRAAIDSLATGTRSIPETKEAYESELFFKYETGELADKIMLPAITVALERQQYSRAGELIDFALTADPEKREEIRTKINTALLPGMRSQLRDALGVVSGSITSDYDMEAARAAGLKPDPTTGHWGSRVPSGKREGMILKAPGHGSYAEMVAEENQRGYKIIRRGNREYSVKTSKKPIRQQKIDATSGSVTGLTRDEWALNLQALEPFKAIFENAGGGANTGAVTAVVAGVESFMTTPEGDVIEERLGTIMLVQKEMAVPGDPLHYKLSKLHVDLTQRVENQRNSAVHARNMERAEEKYQSTNASLAVINGERKVSEAVLFQEFRDKYGDDAEQYIDDYYKMRKNRRTDPVEDMEKVKELTIDSRQAWNRVGSKMLQEAASNAFIAGEISQATFKSINANINTALHTSIALENEFYSTYESTLSKIAHASAGLMSSTTGMIDRALNFDGYDTTLLSKYMADVTLLQMGFKRAWIDWHRTPEVVEALKGDRITYDLMANEKINAMFIETSGAARDLGAELLESKDTLLGTQ